MATVEAWVRFYEDYILQYHSLLSPQHLIGYGLDNLDNLTYVLNNRAFSWIQQGFFTINDWITLQHHIREAYHLLGYNTVLQNNNTTIARGHLWNPIYLQPQYVPNTHDEQEAEERYVRSFT